MIDFKSTLKMAVVSLKINKMRSMLTSLGIIIGVSAVIIMLAVGTGASEKVQKDMESMGSNILTIRSASAKSGGVCKARRNTCIFHMHDRQKRECGKLRLVCQKS